MNALWRAGPRAVVDDVRRQHEGDDLSYVTFQTMLRRMAAKGWIEAEKVAGRLYYTAAVGRREGVEERARDLFEELAEGEEKALEFVRTTLEAEIEKVRKAHEKGSDGPKKKRPRR